MASDKVFFFQIGFNKCATTALYRLFQKAGGVTSLHSAGREHRLAGHPAFQGKHPQLIIADNIAAGRPPVQGFEDIDAFFDMEFVRGDAQIENFRQFAAFADAYPRAKFLLNTRDEADWIRSRLRHADGDYFAQAAQRMDTDMEGVIAQWSADFQEHTAAVRAYFANQPERLLEFDIDTGDIADLIAFAAPDFALSAENWGYQRVTDKIADKRDWDDDMADVDTDDIAAIIDQTDGS